MTWLGRIVIAVNVLAAVVVLVIGAVAWVVSSERGTAWLVELVARRAAPQLTIGATEGTLAGELVLRDVSFVRDDSRAEIDSLSVSFEPGQLLARAVVIESLRVGPARVTYVADDTVAAQRTEFPRLPVAIVVRDAALEGLTLTAAGQTRAVGATRFAGTLIDSTLDLERFDTSVDGITLGTTGRVELRDGIVLELDVTWSGDFDSERWTGSGTLAGTWPVLVLDHALTAPVAVTTTGSVTLETDPVVDLAIRWTDLAWPGIDAATSPAGVLQLSGALDALGYRASGQLVADGVPIDFEAQGTVSPDRVELAPLEIVTRSGSLTATGRFEVAERRFSVAAQGRDLDPGLFAAAWPGRINAAGNVSGVLEPVIEVDFEDLTLDGRVRDYPFTAALDGRFRAPGSFTFEQAEIVSGQDRVTFAGTIDETIALTLEAHAEQLDLLWPELDGVIDANLTLAGTPAAPRAAGSLAAAGLAYGRYALDAARISGSAELFAGGALDVTLEGEGFDLGNVEGATLAARATGTMRAHELTLSLDGEAWRSALAARGALDGGRWDGRLDRLDIDQTAVGEWQLAGPAPLRLAAGVVELEEACLGRLDAELCGALRFTGAPDDRLVLRARGFDLQMLAPLLPEGVAFAGLYTLDADFTNLSREPMGRLVVDGGATRLQFAASERDTVTTDIDEVHLTASLEQRRLALDLALDGRDTGRVSLEATVDDVRDDLSPIKGRLEANWSDLAVLSLLSPDVGAVSGALQVVLDFSGTVDEPEVEGRAAWSDGTVEVPTWGVSVDRINADATSADGSTLEFDASGWVEDAELRLTGRSVLDRSDGWPTELRLTGEAVPVVQLPDAEIYVSPELTVNVTLPRVSVEGSVFVPRARLALEQLPEQAVRPSGDAVVHGVEQEVEAVRPLAVNADIRLVLGDDVTYTGSNLDTTLGGDLRLLYASGQTANASGSLSIEGSYDAYGQSLDLDRGELIFTGPLDDPTLDVRAVRMIGATTVGVQLSGSLKSPQTRMFSDPAMSEADALSYLLLGRPLGGSGDEDSAIVQSAALSMGLQQALPVVQRIGETLGFDEFSIETNDVDTGALMAGKYLSPKIYIRYSYGLFNRIGGLLLRFKINERLSLETRSGDEKSMDLLYTVEKE